MAFYLRFFCQRKCHTLLSSSDSQVLVTQTQNCTPFLPYFDVCVLFSPLDVCIFIQIGFFWLFYRRRCVKWRKNLGTHFATFRLLVFYAHTASFVLSQCCIFVCTKCAFQPNEAPIQPSYSIRFFSEMTTTKQKQKQTNYFFAV